MSQFQIGGIGAFGWQPIIPAGLPGAQGPQGIQGIQGPAGSANASGQGAQVGYFGGSGASTTVIGSTNFTFDGTNGAIGGLTITNLGDGYLVTTNTSTGKLQTSDLISTSNLTGLTSNVQTQLNSLVSITGTAGHIPVITSTGSGLEDWANYNGTIRLDTDGANTLNIGSTNASAVNIGNSGTLTLNTSGPINIGNTYTQIVQIGGNSKSYMYGSFAALGDGVHWGYNAYYDSAGTGHIDDTGGATSRIAVAFGQIGFYTGNINALPTNQCLILGNGGGNYSCNTHSNTLDAGDGTGNMTITNNATILGGSSNLYIDVGSGGALNLGATNAEFVQIGAPSGNTGVFIDGGVTNGITIQSASTNATTGAITMTAEAVASGATSYGVTIDLLPSGSRIVARLITSTGLWGSSSDRSLKEHITDCDLRLDFINSIKPRSYKMKASQGVHARERHHGFIAQEMKDFVTVGGEEGNMTMCYTELIAPMVAAIQDLSNLTNRLTKRIEILEAEIGVLRGTPVSNRSDEYEKVTGFEHMEMEDPDL